MSQTVPISLVTGFLGSGKSTFINRIIKTAENRRFGFILNEFGSVQLESQIVEADADEVVELSNGCMCCVVRGDLLDAVKRLLKQRVGLNHIIVEASGLSQPLPIAQTFLSENLNEAIRFESIIAVLDCLDGPHNLNSYSVSREQIAAADIVLLSKSDCVDDDAVATASELARQIAPKARVHNLSGPWKPQDFLETTSFDHSSISGLVDLVHNHDDHNHHAEGISSVFIQEARRLDPARFGQLLKSLTGTVIRAKGFLYLDDPQGNRYKFILQCAGARTTIEPKPWKRGEQKQSALVVIGEGIDSEELANRIHDCVVNDK